MLSGRKRHGRRALLLLAALLLLPAMGAGAQDLSGPTGPRYSFFAVRSLADGLTAELQVTDLLPFEEVVSLSSVTSEAQLGVARSDALAVLPNPGDVVLTLPGTLAGLAGLPGLPEYPAAARADHPITAEDEVVFAPDAGLGAFTLRAAAHETGSSATAFVGRQDDLVGLLPPVSIGSVHTTASTRRIDGTSFVAVATTTVSDVRVAEVLRIGQVTTEVEVTVIDGRLSVDASDVVVSGATVAGTTVGITEDGIVGLGQPTALAPVVDTLVRPLVSAGISVRTTPATEEVTEEQASGQGGALEVSFPLSVLSFPGTMTLSLGRASASLEVVGLVPGLDSSGPPTGGVAAEPVPGPPAAPATSLGPAPTAGGLPAGTTPPVPSARPAGGPAGGQGPGSELVAMPVARAIADWDVAALYRAMLVTGAAMFLAARLVARVHVRRSAQDLRPLWRW